MNPAIENKMGAIRQILAGNHVKRAYLFGSMTNAQAPGKSDVDSFIEFDPELSIEEYGSSYFLILEQLEDSLDRSVDLLNGRSLRNPVFIHEIESTRIPIFG
ncbi:MAG: nucleotidyltransferase domain-containing protein [Flavobacteriales bacterium]|nr:nucleotidyltransferase domain-containing protein [Flavobacteriales bacterium]